MILQQLTYSRPVTLLDCARIVAPPPWIGHIPFAFWLVDVLRPRRFVELGTQTGNSFCAFVQAADHFGIKQDYFAVDHWEGDGMVWEYDETGYGDRIFNELKSHLNQTYEGWPQLLRMSFDEARDQFQDGSIDLLHIDGNHTYEAALSDFETWLPKLSAAGVVLMHDTTVRSGAYGVYRVVEELKQRYPVFEFSHSNGLAVVQVGKAVPEAFGMLIRGEADQNGLLPQQYFGKLGAAIMRQQNLEDVAAALSDISLLKAQLGRLAQQSELLQSKLQSSFDEINQRVQAVVPAQPTVVDAGSVTPEDLLRSKYFDAPYYRDHAALPDLDDEALARHYLEEGESKGLRPSSAFDPAFYAGNNPDVVNAKMGLLSHFLSFGYNEGRLPVSVFPEAAASGEEQKA